MWVWHREKVKNYLNTNISNFARIVELDQCFPLVFEIQEHKFLYVQCYCVLGVHKQLFLIEYIGNLDFRGFISSFIVQFSSVHII